LQKSQIALYVASSSGGLPALEKKIDILNKDGYRKFYLRKRHSMPIKDYGNFNKTYIK
jgi:hypothetical protein